MRFFQRLLLLAAIIAFGVWLFYIGREHQVFLDNKTVSLGTESGGQNYKALAQVNVAVNGNKPVELFARERDVATVVGPKFKVRVEVLDDIGGSVVKTIEREVTIGFEKNIMINMPILAGNDEDNNNFILPAP